MPEGERERDCLLATRRGGKMAVPGLQNGVAPVLAQNSAYRHVLEEFVNNEGCLGGSQGLFSIGRESNVLRLVGKWRKSAARSLSCAAPCSYFRVKISRKAMCVHEEAR